MLFLRGGDKHGIYLQIFNYFVFINNFDNFNCYIYKLKKTRTSHIQNSRTSNVMKILRGKL